jgi:hypothetical protein
MSGFEFFIDILEPDWEIGREVRQMFGETAIGPCCRMTSAYGLLKNMMF